MAGKKTALILGLGSGIGKGLAEFYLAKGYSIVGTYRNKPAEKWLSKNPDVHLVKCDFSKLPSIEKAGLVLRKIRLKWSIFISCIGTMEPIGKFFSCDFNAWEKSIMVNFTGPLRFLHKVYQYRSHAVPSGVVFFAGAGTNNPAPAYSAYCVSKISLIKICELLDNEYKDLNVFIVGPGWVRTKIHAQTLRSRHNSGINYKRTVKFLSGADGTAIQDICGCIDWCSRQGRKVAGGRNFSVVHDSWKSNESKLKKELLANNDKFKLRRFKNN